MVLGSGVAVGVGLEVSVGFGVGVLLGLGGGDWLGDDVAVGGALVNVGGGAVGRGARDSSQAVNRSNTLNRAI